MNKAVKIYAVFIATLVSLILISPKQALASDGYFSLNIDYTKYDIAWNFYPASTINLNQGEWVDLRMNVRWVFSSGCWPGAGEPNCTDQGSSGYPNTVVTWSFEGCPAGAKCTLMPNHDSSPSSQLTWNIVSNFTYQPFVMVENTGAVQPGTYRMTFRAKEYPTACSQSGGNCISEVSRSVYLVIQEKPKPTINLSTTSLSFSATSGSLTPSSQTINLWNTGNANLSWNATTDQNWCHVSPSSGNLSPNSNTNLAVSVDAPSNIGTFNCTVTVTDPNASNSPRQFNVRYTVLEPARALLSLNVNNFNFSGVTGEGQPAPQTLRIRNSGTQSLTWTGRTNQSWCRINGQNNSASIGGTLFGGAFELVNLSVDAPSNVGTFYCVVTITSPEAENSPQNAVITYSVISISRPTINLSTTSLSFSATSGSLTPSSQTINLWNTGNANLSWNATTDQNWCHVSPSSGNLSPNSNTNLAVSVDAPSNIGTFNCTVTVTDPNASNSPRALLVNYQVSAEVIGNPTNVRATANNCSSISLTWNAGANATKYHIFRSINGQLPIAPYKISYEGTSFTDTTVSSNNFYYYWVESLGGDGFKVPATQNFLGGVSLTSCPDVPPVVPPTSSGSPNLSSSDKNLRAISGKLQPNQDCDGKFQGLPLERNFREDDVLTYEVNLCNLNGTGDALNVIVKDNLMNFNQPSDGWKAVVDGVPLIFVYGQPGVGEYSYDVATKILTFNLGRLSKQSAKQIIYEVKIQSESSTTNPCPKCQNKASLLFESYQSGFTQVIDLLTPAIFYRKN